MPRAEEVPSRNFQASYRDTYGRHSRILTQHPFQSPLAYFCHNGWKTYLRSQFPEQLGGPTTQAEVPKRVMFLSKQGKACHNKSPSLWSSHFFLPGTQIRCLEVQQPTCDHETSWQMKATVLRMVTQRDSRSQEAAAPALSWPHLDFYVRWENTFLIAPQFLIFAVKHVPNCQSMVYEIKGVTKPQTIRQPRLSSQIILNPRVLCF